MGEAEEDHNRGRHREFTLPRENTHVTTIVSCDAAQSESIFFRSSIRKRALGLRFKRAGYLIRSSTLT
jgi:hypothetical protein